MHPIRNRLLQQLAITLLALLTISTASAADWIYRVRPHDNIWDLSSRYLKPDVP